MKKEKGDINLEDPPKHLPPGTEPRTKEARRMTDPTSNIGEDQQGFTKVMVRTPEPKLYTHSRRFVTNHGEH
ncbi:BTB/POZ domain-containing protein [Pyrus ussuriensis x Pyrus communis]|uniref:BTB/POZ domain-containing protein n=1 Tax=Pyrus ussuriensis x Pyrus communis TaxID=2448454 RepID=A0A5N5G945_9ROSA|nr:BTB/POZ domain-containing protein [Pyrus ussuriensis x Pyrus communis]